MGMVIKMAKEITKTFYYNYDGRTEMVDRGNNLTGMRVKLSTYGGGCCVGPTSFGKQDDNRIDGELSLEVSGQDFFKIFKDYGEFEVTIKGVKSKKE